MSEQDSQYDVIAEKYDLLFTDEDSIEENAKVGVMLQPLDGSVLDIGCGTGLLTEILTIEPQKYFGIDPSAKMLDRFINKHPDYKKLLCASYDGVIIDCNDFDNIVALFGAASYLDETAIESLANSRSRKFLMFYKDDYHPVTYEKCGVEFLHNKHSKETLANLFCNDSVEEFDNYFIVR